MTRATRLLVAVAVLAAMALSAPAGAGAATGPNFGFKKEWGNAAGPGQLCAPRDIAYNFTNSPADPFPVYVANGCTSSVYEYSSEGAFKDEVGASTDPEPAENHYGVGTERDASADVWEVTCSQVKRYHWSTGAFVNELNHGLFCPTDSEVSNGRVFLAGYNNNNVFACSTTPTAGGGCSAREFDGPGDANFTPWSLAIDTSGSPGSPATTPDIFATDPNDGKVYRFDFDGDLEASWGSVGTGDGQFGGPATGPNIENCGFGGGPYGITYDPTSDHVFVADCGNERIQEFDKDGNFISKFGVEGGSHGKFLDPWGVAADQNGNIYVTDVSRSMVVKFGPRPCDLTGSAVVGTPAGETICGTSGPDVLEGGGGNDIILGFAGKDRIEGGADNDIIEGGDDSDLMMDGGTGPTGADSFNGGGGPDDMVSYADRPTFVNASINAGTNDDGEQGEGDDIDGTVENLVGGDAGDLLQGDLSGNYNQPNTLAGGPGTDVIYGYGGNDKLRGGADGDALYGHEGNDTVEGQDGDDGYVNGGPGNDTLTGGLDADQLYGEAGNDTLEGGLGRVTCAVCGDNDYLSGGTDEDVVLYQKRTADLELNADDDDYNDGQDDNGNGVAEDDYIENHDVENISGGSGDDTIHGNALANTLKGGLGTDTLRGRGANDYLDGGPGPVGGADDNDTLFGETGTGDRVSYELRTNRVFVTSGVGSPPDDGETGELDNVSADIEQIVGGKNDDRITGGPATTFLSGGPDAGNDELIGGNVGETLRGEAGNDILRAVGGGIDNLRCGLGVDQFEKDPSDTALTDCEQNITPLPS